MLLVRSVAVIGRGDQGWGGLALRSEPASDVGDERDYGGHRYVGDHEEHGTERRVFAPSVGDEAFQ
jgi:hypothetical protein